MLLISTLCALGSGAGGCVGNAPGRSSTRLSDGAIAATIRPSEGSTAGGTPVLLQASGIADGVSVIGATVDGIAAENYGGGGGGELAMTVVTPAHAAGTVDIVLTLSDGARVQASYLYREGDDLPPTPQPTPPPAPELLAISPLQGSTAGNTLLTVYVRNYLGQSQVTVDGQPVPFFGSSCGGSSDVLALQLYMPAHAAGPVSIALDGASGAPATFTYRDDLPAPPPPPPPPPPPTVSIDRVDPAEGSTAGYNQVTIYGQHFEALEGVFVDGVAVGAGGSGAGSGATGVTSLTLLTPPHAAGTVLIEVRSFGQSVTVPFTYRDDLPAPPPPTPPAPPPAPVILAISPNVGATAGGTAVTLVGHNLSPQVTVDGVAPGGMSGTGDGSDVTTMYFTMPPHAAGSVDVVMVDPSGQRATVQFTYRD